MSYSKFQKEAEQYSRWRDKNNFCKQLWKAILRHRLEGLWSEVSCLICVKSEITLEEINEVDLSGFNPFSSSESILRMVAYDRWYTLQGISKFKKGLEQLLEKDEIKKQQLLYEVVLKLTPPKPKPTIDRRKIDEDLFWELMDANRSKSNNQFEFLEYLRDQLEQFKPNEIRKFDKFLITKMNELKSWDMWALAYIVRSGCGDDAFDYFRAWVVSKGKHAFIGIKDLKKERLNNLFDEDPQLEEFMYLVEDIYESKIGDLMKPVRVKYQKNKGTPWDEEDLEKDFPEWCRLFEYGK